ncbi:retrovirus-related pol polyprotein from transposon TNT 1-94 [Tanacetum coccineum]|uniref:Retrovirus-related pol polyprotein from transposon TNT 1-94 n=1 Tax=Tanacetum coccineum TaxID=301880 RepID=A0ABQ4WVT7_9ASTR
MSAKDKNGLGYGTQLDEMSNKYETDSEISMSVFEVRSSDEEITPANDRFSKADGYHAVPPSITGNLLTPRADISFACLDEYAIRKKIIESKTDTTKSKTSETVGKTNEVNIEKPKSVHELVVSKPKINRDKVIIEDWNSDDEDDVSSVKTVSPVKTNETQTVRNRVDKVGQISQKEGIGFKKIKACFVCKSTDHLIKDCDFYDKKSPEPKLKTVGNTGQRVIKPLWDNANRVNQQNISNKLKYPQARRTFVPSGVLTRTCNPENFLQDHAVVDSGLALAIYELKFNLFSVLQMSDKKNSVLFTDTECLILSPSFKLLDESQVVFRAPRQNDVYSLDLKNIVPSVEFKNHAMNEFCAKKRIKKEFSVARTPQQNGVAERKNRTLIEAARTMLAYSLLPILFWAEAINTACYVLNRILVTKPQNKTPYELLIGKPPSISFMRPFGCPLTILNTLDPLGKFDGKSDEGYLLGYSTSSKAFRVYNKRTKRVEESLHIDLVTVREFSHILFSFLHRQKNELIWSVGDNTQ